MKAAFETLDAKKDELGLTAVIAWVCEAKDLYWSTGNHSFGAYLDAGPERQGQDPARGSAGVRRFLRQAVGSACPLVMMILS